MDRIRNQALGDARFTLTGFVLSGEIDTLLTTPLLDDGSLDRFDLLFLHRLHSIDTFRLFIEVTGLDDGVLNLDLDLRLFNSLVCALVIEHIEVILGVIDLRRNVVLRGHLAYHLLEVLLQLS